MNRIIKYLTNRTVRPLIVRHLSKARTFHHNGIKLIIPPGVFHPAFFFSSKILLQYVEMLELQQLTFLELGAGSGITAFTAAKKGATVTATDINTIAVHYLLQNSNANNIPVKVILSDLFDKIPVQQFDVIVVNPPFYKKEPVTEAEYAWYCGPEGEYFTCFFSDLRKYIHQRSQVLMVLSDECDMEMIKSIATKNGFRMELQLTKQKAIERLYIYKIIDSRIG